MLLVLKKHLKRLAVLNKNECVTFGLFPPLVYFQMLGILGRSSVRPFIRYDYPRFKIFLKNMNGKAIALQFAILDPVRTRLRNLLYVGEKENVNLDY